MKYKKTKIGLIILVVSVITFRAALPILIKNRVNQILAENPDISGGVDDVDLWLLSGRVELNPINVYKANHAIPAPIFAADSLAFSISWKDLIRGRLFADIEAKGPVLNVVDAPSEAESQTGAEIDWRRALVSFYPFEINRIQITRGEAHFRNFNSEPPVDLYLENIEAKAINITNQLSIEDSKAAQINLTATTIGKGEIRLESEFNLLREPAKVWIKAELVGMNLTAVNDFARAYVNLDVQEGLFNLTTNFNFLENDEIADIDGALHPVVQNLNVLRWQDDVKTQKDPSLIIVWEGLVDGVKWLLEAGPQDKIETVIPIKGTIENPDIKVGSAALGLIKNAVQSWFSADGDDKTSDQDNTRESADQNSGS